MKSNKQLNNNITIDYIIKCNDSILQNELNDLYDNVLYDVLFEEYYNKEEPTIEDLKRIEKEEEGLI